MIYWKNLKLVSDHLMDIFIISQSNLPSRFWGFQSIRTHYWESMLNYGSVGRVRLFKVLPNYLMNILVKFGSNMPRSFCVDDWTVKSLQTTTDAKTWQQLKWPFHFLCGLGLKNIYIFPLFLLSSPSTTPQL